MKQSPDQDNTPLIGIIMLDTAFPRIYGDIGNPDTFSFPVLYKTVEGATSKRVVMDADRELLHRFIFTAKELENDGVKAIGTSCGFLAMFQQEMNQAVSIPVYTSSLIQAHFVNQIIKNDQKIGILTAHEASLTAKHLSGVGIADFPLAIKGMDEAVEFVSVFIGGKKEINVEKCRQELVAAAQELRSLHPDIGAIILECTNMVPFTRDIQKTVALPVFDVVSMLNYVHSSVSQQKFLSGIDFQGNSQK